MERRDRAGFPGRGSGWGRGRRTPLRMYPAPATPPSGCRLQGATASLLAKKVRLAGEATSSCYKEIPGSKVLSFLFLDEHSF